MDEINYLMCDDLADLHELTCSGTSERWNGAELDQIADGLAGEDTRDQGDYDTPVTYVNDPLAVGLTMAEILTRMGGAPVAEIAAIEAMRRARFGVSAAEAQGTVEL